MKRTTLALDEYLLERARARAAAKNMLLQDCINELLRTGLEVAESEARPPAGPLRLRAFAMGEPTVDLTDRDALQAILEAE